MLAAYGAYGEKKLYGKTVVGVIRSTFVIDAEGKIELAQYGVKATGHVAKLRRDLGLARRLHGRLRRPAGLGSAAPVGSSGRWGRSPMAEAHGLGPCQWGFESPRPYSADRSCRRSRQSSRERVAAESLACSLPAAAGSPVGTSGPSRVSAAGIRRPQTP